MNESLLTVRGEVKSRLMLTNTSEDGRVDSELRTAIRQLTGKPYWFLEKLGTVALSVGDSSASAPTDFSILGSASIVQNNRRYGGGDGQFRVIPYQDLEAEYLYVSPPANATKPDAMAIMGSTFYLSHTLTTAATLSLRYYRKDVTLPTLDDDTSVFFGDEALDVVVGLSQALFEARAQGQQLDSAVVNSFIEKLDREHERRVQAGML